MNYAIITPSSHVGFSLGSAGVSYLRPSFRNQRDSTPRLTERGPFPLRPFSFRDLNLRQAEESLVAACLDHEHAIVAATRELGLHPFRSEAAWELDRYYVMLVNAYVRGCYSESENRTVLALVYPDDDFRIKDDLYDGNTAVAAYCDALIEALRDTYDAQDTVVRAVMAITDAPIYLVPGSPPPAPRPLRRPRPPNERRGRGGVE